MKKIIYLFLPFMALSACSTDAVDSENFDSLDAQASKNASALVSENPMGFYSGNSGQLKGTFSISNDCSNLYLQVSPTADNPEDVKIWLNEGLPALNGNKTQINEPFSFDLSDADGLVWTIPLSTLDTEKNINIFVKAWGDYTGPLSYEEVVYSAYRFDLAGCACEESFSYAAGEGANEYIFTYVPAEDMTAAELVFTFAQSVAVSGLEGWTNKGNATSSTETKTMDLEACERYSWTVTLEKECMGNTGNNNLWTDFKVNDVSKKGELANIKQSCN